MFTGLEHSNPDLTQISISVHNISINHLHNMHNISINHLKPRSIRGCLHIMGCRADAVLLKRISGVFVGSLSDEV